MKIIEPSAEIIEDELANLSIYQRIAYCAGVCYQREPNKTEEEAQAFCKKMVKIGHMSTLEMAVVHINAKDWVGRQLTESNKFIKRSSLSNRKSIVTGSVRSFLETDSTIVSHYLFNDGVFTENTYQFKKAGLFRTATSEEIPWQHQHVAVKFIVNRAVSHELVRHRPMSFLQESQRYCRYEDEVIFVRPEWMNGYSHFTQTLMVENHLRDSERRYRELLKSGLKPQQARAVLPNSTKTELIAYASLPQWKHIFNLRCSPAADPEMRRVMIPLRDQFKTKYPEAEI